MRRAWIVVVGVALVSGCVEDAAQGSPAELRTLREAAALGEARFGVPASLTLAVGYTETRWQLPEGGEHEGHEHMPSVVGVGGLRPWLAIDPVGLAAEELAVDREALERDPALSLLGTAAVLRALAEARGAVPASDDPGAWGEVLGDYAGLESESARESYRHEVLGWIARGVAAIGADGQEVVLHASPVRLPETIGAAREHGGAEYAPARWVASPNYNSRGGTNIDRIVIHTTQGSYAGAISWFQNPDSDVSAHYVIRSSDGEVTQMVREANRGWHVGTWNSRSIGIEHEGWVADPGRWYTDAMYRSSAALTRHLCNKYGIPIDRTHIVGHVEAPGATHTDPGSGWDWDRYLSLVRGEPPRPAYAASYSAQSAPAEMTSGERAVAWIEYRNDGANTWSLDRTRLGTASPRDHASPFYDVENWISSGRASGPDHSDYATGRVGRFTFMITAPEVTSDTTITDHFQPVEEGVTWFGPESTISVLVHPRPGTGPVDADGDGSPSDADCDDADASRHPGATELCGDGIDADCDGVDPSCEPATPDAGARASDAGPELPSPDDAGTPVAPSDPGGGREMLTGGCSCSASGPSRAELPGGGPLLLVALGMILVVRRSA